MSKDMIGFEMYINWEEPIVLCEGVFDAIAIRNNAIPLLGKFPSRTLLSELAYQQPKRIYVALDTDAKKDALKLVKFLMDSGIKTYLLEMNDKDPSELGFKGFWKIAEEAKPFKFSDVVKGRLYA